MTKEIHIIPGSGLSKPGRKNPAQKKTYNSLERRNPMAGEEALIVHMIQKKIVRKFQDQCATDPRQAMTLESLGVKKIRMAKSLAKKKILVAVSNDRYYLDEEAAEGYFRKKRFAAIAALVAGIILALVIGFIKK